MKKIAWNLFIFHGMEGLYWVKVATFSNLGRIKQR